MIKMKANALAACLLSAAACATPTAEERTDFDAEARALLAAAFPSDGPGTVVIVTRNDETVFLESRGMADMESGRPIEDDTVFRLASITKQFSAATLMLLVEDGLIDLDAPVSRYLPDYPEPGASVPVRRLLDHTSGIPSFTDLDGAMSEDRTARAYSTNEMIAIFDDLPLHSPPGEQYRYNNSAYVLVGALIEAVTNRPWHEVVEDRIAAPLGLDTIQSGLAEEEVGNRAKGYSGGETARPSQIIHMSYPHAAGSLIGNIEDLADWADAFHGGEVVSAESYRTMTTPTSLNDGSQVPYRYGLQIGEIRGRETIGHDGRIFGFATESVYFPEDDVFVAILANTDTPRVSTSQTIKQVAALAVGDPYRKLEKVDADLDALEPLFGFYESDDAERSFFRRGSKIFTARPGSSELEVFPAGDSVFFYGADSLTWFEIDADGPTMLFHTDGEPGADLLERTSRDPKVVRVRPALLTSYLGTYDLTIPGDAVVAAVDGDVENGITLQPTGQPPFRMVPLSDTEFSIPSEGATVRFVLGEDGSTAMVINIGGQTIRGERQLN